MKGILAKIFLLSIVVNKAVAGQLKDELRKLKKKTTIETTEETTSSKKRRSSSSSGSKRKGQDVIISDLNNINEALNDEKAIFFGIANQGKEIKSKDLVQDVVDGILEDGSLRQIVKDAVKGEKPKEKKRKNPEEPEEERRNDFKNYLREEFPTSLMKDMGIDPEKIKVNQFKPFSQLFF